MHPRFSTLIGLLCAGVAVLPMQAQGSPSSPMGADAFAPYGGRILSDPLFLPTQGQISGQTGYSQAKTDYDGINSAGLETSSTQSRSYNWNQSFAYGLSNDFTLRLSGSWAHTTADATSDKTGIVSSTCDRGFADPTLGATWRLVEQSAARPFDFDLAASYSPNSIALRTGSGAQVGTVASGRQTALVSAGIGREMRAMSLQLVVSSTYLGQRSYEALSNGDQHSEESRWEYGMALNTQTRFTSRDSLNVNITDTVNRSYQAADDTAGTSWNTTPANSVAISAALNHHFIPDHLVGTLFYTYTTNADASNQYATPVRDNSTHYSSSNTAGCRVSYMF